MHVQPIIPTALFFPTLAYYSFESQSITGLAETTFSPSNRTSQQRPGILGDLFRESFREQLLRLRDGDRFYYKNPGHLTTEEAAALDKVRLSNVRGICFYVLCALLPFLLLLLLCQTDCLSFFLLSGHHVIAGGEQYARGRHASVRLPIHPELCVPATATATTGGGQ